MTTNAMALAAAGVALAGCAVAGPAAMPVAGVRLDQAEMTPFELVLARDVPEGTELRLRQESRLRPVIVGVFQVTNVSAQGVSLPLRDVPTLADVTGKWGQYEKSGLLAILKAAKDLPAGTKLTVRGHKYDGLSPINHRYAWRQSRVWLEPLATNQEPAAVSEPLIVRTVSGPAEYIRAYRKPDGRLQIQAFDKSDNPADAAGASYTICGDLGVTLKVPARPEADLTEVELPQNLRLSRVLEVSDSGGRTCRSTPLAVGLDGRGIYFGDMHYHTSFSDGDYPTEDAILWARTRVGLDFTGPGDHISEQGDFAGLTAADYAKYGRTREEPGRFCRMPALEIAGPTGHQLLLARDFDTFVAVMAQYVEQVGTKPGLDAAGFCTALTGIMVPGKTIIVPAHPIGTPNRWPDIADKSAFMAGEIMRGPGGQETYEKEPQWHCGGMQGKDESTIRYALSIGYRMAFVGCSDNHRPLPGQPQAVFHGMTAVQTKILDTASVFDAICAGRSYATTGARIVADATLNGAPIGSDVPAGADAPRKFHVMIQGTAPLVEAQIIHCGQVLKTFPADTYEITLDWTDQPAAGQVAPKYEYYYVRARQADGHCVWLSPFWIRQP